MIASSWIMGLRGKLNQYAAECDSEFYVSDSKLTSVERSALRQRLRDDVAWIDKKLA